MNVEITFTAVVVCLNQNDPRLSNWGRLLSSRFQHVWLIWGRDGWGEFNLASGEIASVPKAQRPVKTDVVLIHRSDDIITVGEILNSFEIGYKRFVFSGPGIVSAEGVDIPIMRGTNPFALNERDSSEICDYVAGKRVELPSCCKPEETSSCLFALAVLCQGYLVARNRADLLGIEAAPFSFTRALPNDLGMVVTKPDWWRKPFDGINLVDAVAKECGGDVPSEVRKLLDSPGGEDETAVAAAHSKIRELLKQ